MSVWGVDTGLSRTTLCGLRVAGGGGFFHRVATDKAEGDIAERLRLLRERTIAGAQALADSVIPEAVFIERPTGSFPNPHLDWACGVATMAAHEALMDLYGAAPPIAHVAVSTWKKATVGRGNAQKIEVLAWAQAHDPIAGVDQDAADAYCIASYGVATCG